MQICFLTQKHGKIINKNQRYNKKQFRSVQISHIIQLHCSTPKIKRKKKKKNMTFTLLLVHYYTLAKTLQTKVVDLLKHSWHERQKRWGVLNKMT